MNLERGQDHVRRALDTIDALYTVLCYDSDQQAYRRDVITISFWFSFFVSEHFHTEGDASRWLVFTAHYLGLFGFGLSIGDSIEIAWQILCGLGHALPIDPSLEETVVFGTSSKKEITLGGKIWLSAGFEE